MCRPFLIPASSVLRATTGLANFLTEPDHGIILLCRRVFVNNQEVKMKLGAFSVRLSVKDLEASKSFYEKLGFSVFGGNAAQNWLIMKNGEHTIGLFQGMFEKNILTFNPGWDQEANIVESYTDVRDLQQELRAQGIKMQTEADETTRGPASFVVIDPDGNPILVDQHV